jgi:hypothetical protein
VIASKYFGDVGVSMAALGCEECHHDHPFHIDGPGDPCKLTAFLVTEEDVPEHTYLGDGKASCSMFARCPCSPDFDPERVPLAPVVPIPGQLDVFGGVVS